MKKILCLALFLQIHSLIEAQPPRLIVRGDDMGYTHSGNEALIKCFKEGIETSIEVIVPSPWFPEAVKLLKQNPTVDVGIHLALTSEWDNIKWRPLTDCTSLRDSNGYFYPMVYPNKNYPGQAIKDHQWKIEDVEKEFRAQIEMALKLIPRVSHISSHMGCTSLSDEVKQLTAKLAKEYNIAAEPGWSAGLLPFRLDKNATTPDQKIQSFLDTLANLQPGKTYIFVEHPGLDNDELRAVHHIGNEDVATARQDVTNLFTNEKIKALIKQKRIALISYKDLQME